MRWKNALFIAVVWTQVSLVTIVVYLIRSCIKFPHSLEELGRKKQKIQEDFDSTAWLAYNKLFTFKVFPTTSLNRQSQVGQMNAFPKEKMYNPESSGTNRTLVRKDTFMPIQKPEDNQVKKRLKLVVAILSAPIRFDRREGIRRTWMKDCNSEEVVCRFFTDSLSDMEPKVQTVLANESIKYDDLEFMPVPKGYNFGLRLLWLMEWSTQKYNFDFFLRMDDDYFVCLKRLLFEIPFRPQKR